MVVPKSLGGARWINLPVQILVVVASIQWSDVFVEGRRGEGFRVDCNGAWLRRTSIILGYLRGKGMLVCTPIKNWFSKKKLVRVDASLCDERELG